MTEVDQVHVVQQMWPADGPHTADSLRTAAVASSELFSTLANATVVRAATLTALPTVPDGYGLLGGLAAAASSEHDLLEHLATWAKHFAADPTLRHADHRDRPRSGVDQAQQSALETADALREAAGHAEALTRALHRAWARTSPLYHDNEEDR